MSKVCIFPTVLMMLMCSFASYADLLPADTPVQVGVDQMIDADKVKLGETITAHLVSPVKNNGQLVFPMGTIVKGMVTQRKNNFIAGIPGSIEVGEFKMFTPNGSILPLKGNILRQGDSRTAVAVLAGYIFLFPLFIKGQDGKIEAGAESTMTTTQEYEYK